MTDEIRAPLEFREATLVGVNFAQRTVEVIAVPYNEEALIEYRGEMWRESFLPGAFDNIEKRPNRVRANRDHDKTRTVGKVIAFYPSREEGLIAEIRIGHTQVGDETLALANEDMLSPSAGFGVPGSGQILDRPFRRITKAYLDHIAFVESPAYQGARVVSVRSEGESASAASLPPLVTPHLDEITAWLRARQ